MATFRYIIVRIIFAWSTIVKSHAFSPTSRSRGFIRYQLLREVSPSAFQTSKKGLFLSEETNAEPVETNAEGTSEEVPEKEIVEQPTEDPEITALKEKIASLESDLKLKRSELSRTKDAVDDFTEKGYMIRCAEIDNMRRRRAQASADTLEVQRVNVLKNFIPVLKELKELDAQVAEDEFAKKYSALRWDFENALKSFGVSEFTVDIGTKFDTNRCVAVGEEDVEGADGGVVLRVEQVGYEVKGNVIRSAEVVISKGQEDNEESEKRKEDGEEA